MYYAYTSSHFPIMSDELNAMMTSRKNDKVIGSSYNAAHLLLDALQAPRNSSCVGITERLLTSALGVTASAPSAKRDLIHAYQSSLFTSSSGSSSLMVLNNVKKLELLISRLEEAIVIRSQPLSTTATIADSNSHSNKTLSILIVLTRLIGSSNQAPIEQNLYRKQKATNQSPSKFHSPIHCSKNDNNTCRIDDTISGKDNPTKSDTWYKKPSVSSSHGKEHIILVRECIYTLQGIDGSLMKFRNRGEIDTVDSDTGVLEICPRLVHNISDVGTLSNYVTNGQQPLVTLDAIQLCGECGWLFLRIQKFINQNTTATNYGTSNMIARALAEALSDELTQYHSFVAKLLEEQQQSSTKLFTLNHLVFAIRNAKLKLHALALLVEECNKKKKYPAHHYSSVIHVHTQLLMASSSRKKQTFSDNGVALPLLFHKIASRTSLPLYQKMFEWVFYGILPQKKQETESFKLKQKEQQDFFIAENALVDDAYLWWDCTNEISSLITEGHDASTHMGRREPIAPRYNLIKSMIPIFIPLDMARMMLNIGKGVNFVRKCLGDRTWELMDQLLLLDNKNENSEHKDVVNKEAMGFIYGSVEMLQKTLIQCQKIVHSHIVTMLLERHSLQQHVLLMKKCLLLSQGDFVQTVIESLDANMATSGADDDLDDAMGGGASITLPPRYALQILVDNALHNTNYFKSLSASFLSRIVVVISSITTSGNNGNSSEDREKRGSFKWDDFSLDYTVDAPLTSVIHPVAQSKYQLMFRLIWRCKHIEYMLSKTWRSAVTVHRTVLKISREEEEQQQGWSSAAGHSARMVLRRTAMTRQKAMHFFSNFLSYLSYEVLETSWKELQANLKNSKTLDDLVRSHDMYMNNILTKSMLLVNSNDHDFTDTTTTATPEETSSLAINLSSVLSAAARFTAAEERIFATAVNGLEKASRLRRAAENRLKENKWGYEKTPLFSSDVLEAAFSESNAVLLDLVISAADDLDAALKKFITKLFEQTDDHGSDEDDEDYHHPVAAEATPDNEATPTPLVHRHIRPLDRCCNSLQFLAFRLDFNQFYAKDCRNNYYS